MNVGRRLARLATDAVVRRPGLWRLFRWSIRRQFDHLAPHWDEILTPTHLAPFERALDAVAEPPPRALDVGTGTGAGAFAIAARWPETEVVGVDVAEGMLAQARRNLPAELQDRVRFLAADASALPFPDESFELVTLANMIPFFDELQRVAAPGGHVIFSFSGGSETPIYVANDRLRAELGRRGFEDFQEVAAGRGTGFLARKVDGG